MIQDWGDLLLSFLLNAPRISKLKHDTCEKKKFKSKAAATKFLGIGSRNNQGKKLYSVSRKNKYMRVYFCDICKFYHLTTKSKNGYK